MKDNRFSLSNPVVQKLAMVLVAAALYIAGNYMPGVKDALQLLAASVAGGAMIRRPGDVKDTPEDPS